MILILLLVAIVTLIYYLRQWENKYNKYWEDKGIPYVNAKESFADFVRTMLRWKSMNKQHKELYFKFPGAPCIGSFLFTKPAIIVRDLDLVEKILIKDFAHFTDRGFGEVAENGSPVDVNLFNMQGKKWKALRNKLSPMFTTNKLKTMIPQIERYTSALVLALEKKENEVDIRDYLQRYAMDIIASCAFGISINAIGEKEESMFRKMGKKAFTLSPAQFIRIIIITILPKVGKMLKLTQNHPDVVEYFSSVIREALKQRRSAEVRRNDFVQQFVDLQEKGSLEFIGDADDDYLKMDVTAEDRKIEHYELTDDVVTGQALIFLLAGFEGAANTLTFLCLELARNPIIQEKVREEALLAQKSQNGALDYDSMKKMTYLDQCVKEIMRMYSFNPILFRECTKEYAIPGTSVTLKPGDAAFISLAGIHSDPAIYPEPEKFKPERFDPDVTRPICSWLPFGDGPRVCIAMRFALMEIKLCMARIVLDFDLQMNPKTVYPIEEDPKNFGLVPKQPIYLDLKKRQNP